MLDAEILALQDLLFEEQERLTSMTSTVSDVRVKSTHNVHKFDRAAILEDKIRKKIEEEEIVKGEIFDLIFSIDDVRIRMLLTLKYIRRMTWEQVAKVMHYEERHIYRLRKAALMEVAEKLKKMS